MRVFFVPLLSLAVVAAAVLAGASGRGQAHSGSSILLHVLFAMSAVAALAQVVGLLFQRLRQPAVVGEMLAGILLGPSLLGRISPSAAEFLLPTEAAPHLGLVAQIGVVLFMFLVGLELDVPSLRRRVSSAAAISVAGILVPLALGSCTAVLLHPFIAPPGVGRPAFAAFFAVAMSVTAFPVLARIVAERRLQKTPLGIMALTCAAIDDASAWCLLAIVASLAGSRAGEGLVTLGLTVVYVVFMLAVVRPLLARLVDRAESPREAIPSVLLLLLVSALATEWIGVHALFGAFLLGAIVEADGAVARRLREQIEDVVHVVFLPVFFAYTGMRTEVGLLSTPADWLLCAGIVVLAFVVKLGGVSVTARAMGMTWRQATALGILMNTRGLMELIVLNVGLDLGIISRSLFTMMVLMALVTTFAGAPLLDWVGRRETTGDDGGGVLLRGAR